MSNRRRIVAAFTAGLIGLLWLPALIGPAQAAAPVLTQDTSTSGCNGVVTTPGSQNTSKQLDPTFASDFNPGGQVGYVIDFPVDAGDVGGNFRITDCIYADPPGPGADAPLAKYFIDFVANSTSFQLRFVVPIPADTPMGSRFCNYAKTTESPSASQASNRKAGPACFTVGGGLSVEKRDGSATGPLLPGASFSVVCSPTTSTQPTIITGLSNPSATLPNGTVAASGTVASGTIQVNGPSGTPCTVAETAAPDGYLMDPTPRVLTIPVGSSQTISVFVNHQLGSLSVSKEAVGAGGTFSFTVTCDDGNTYDGFDLTVAAGATETHVVSETLAVGTECTVSEATSTLFATTSTPANGTVTIDGDGETVAFTNTRRTGSLVVNKGADVDGTFSFDVDCDGRAYDATLQITTVAGVGSARIDGIPTTVSCTVTEQANPEFSSVVIPADGTVVIAVGDNTVAFTNTRVRGDLLIAKTADVDGAFTFDVDCTDDAYDASNVSITTSGGTGSASISGIPSGVSCTVTEDADPLYTTTVVPANGTVTLDDDGETVSFSNLRKRGSLIVTKAITDATASGPYDFTFHVTCGGAAYPDVHLGTADGLSLSDQVDGIPTGTSCAVTEDIDDSWSVTAVPGDGTVTISETPATVAFSNVKLYTDVTLVKSADPASGTAVAEGDTITYTLAYANTGNIAADVTIEDQVPPGTTYVAGSAADGSLVGGLLTWDRTIAAGDSFAVSFAVTVDEDLPDPTTIRNVAVLREGDSATLTNETEHPVAHVAVTKAVDRGTARFGDSLTYTLTVTNPSAAHLTDVVVRDPVPAGTTFVSAGQGGTCAAPCTVVTWPAVDLAVGESVARTFVVRIDTPTPAADGAIPSVVIRNSGEVDTAETDPAPSNEVRTTVTEVLGVKVTKPRPTPPAPALPVTGAPLPVPGTVGVAVAMILVGAGLTFGPARRVRRPVA